MLIKFDAYRFESGKRSLSAQLASKGSRLMMIDKNGKTYEPSTWGNTHIFWRGDQQDLLVADNQTDMYQHGSEEERKILTAMAWGKNE